jgi:phosphatidate phosphatase APP1
VLEESGLRPPQPDAGTVDNLVRMFDRFESDEIADASVRATFKGQTMDVRSDEEGYIQPAFDALGSCTPDTLVWDDMQLELLSPYQAGQPRPVKVDLPILTPPSDAEFAVISDIDDTILKTGATSLLRNLKTTLLNRVDQRLPFLGTAPFYRALQQGRHSAQRNPIFYVSSSPWNLYDFLEAFMELNDIPIGPMFLRDLGWDETKFIKSGHGDHKLSAIETLMDFYPHLRFILIGDSGQHDAGIYRDAVKRYPGRVAAVYIRSLEEAPERDPKAQELLDEIAGHGVETVLSKDLIRVAENAAEKGWIPSSAVEHVAAHVKRERHEH